MEAWVPRELKLKGRGFIAGFIGDLQAMYGYYRVTVGFRVSEIMGILGLYGGPLSQTLRYDTRVFLSRELNKMAILAEAACKRNPSVYRA